MNRKQLFPPIEPFECGSIHLDSPHIMYWEQSGNIDGIPVLFLHGGPGAGAMAVHRRFFDPDAYRVIIFDQRGAGRSEPHGYLDKNTTNDLLSDIERLRLYLKIDKWLIFGGSWGSTLALAYGQKFPERCLGFILRGIFLGTSREVEWFLYGMQTVYPENWSRFVEPLSKKEQNDILVSYHRRLLDDNYSVRVTAARSWSIYESACSTLLPCPEALEAFSSDRVSLALARIEAHYFINNFFMEKDFLISNISKIRNIPGVIVQGRFDMVCPIITADALHHAWPEAEYIVVKNAGHSAMEPGIRSELVRATERFKVLWNEKN